MRRKNHGSTRHDPTTGSAADSPARFLPAYKYFLKLIEWPADEIKERGAGENPQHPGKRPLSAV